VAEKNQPSFLQSLSEAKISKYIAGEAPPQSKAGMSNIIAIVIA